MIMISPIRCVITFLLLPQWLANGGTSLPESLSEVGSLAGNLRDAFTGVMSAIGGSPVTQVAKVPHVQKKGRLCIPVEGRRAFVTAYTGDPEQLWNLRVLVQSLHENAGVADIVVMLPAPHAADRAVRQLLIAEGISTYVMPTSLPATLPVLSAAKISCWALTKYDRVIFLEPNTLVLKNSDALFACDGLCLRKDFAHHDPISTSAFGEIIVDSPKSKSTSQLSSFSTSVMVLEPSKPMFSAIQRALYILSTMPSETQVADSIVNDDDDDDDDDDGKKEVLKWEKELDTILHQFLNRVNRQYYGIKKRKSVAESKSSKHIKYGANDQLDMSELDIVKFLFEFFPLSQCDDFGPTEVLRSPPGGFPDTSSSGSTAFINPSSDKVVVKPLSQAMEKESTRFTQSARGFSDKVTPKTNAKVQEKLDKVGLAVSNTLSSLGPKSRSLQDVADEEESDSTRIHALRDTSNFKVSAVKISSSSSSFTKGELSSISNTSVHHFRKPLTIPSTLSSPAVPSKNVFVKVSNPSALPKCTTADFPHSSNDSMDENANLPFWLTNTANSIGPSELNSLQTCNLIPYTYNAPSSDFQRTGRWASISSSTHGLYSSPSSSEPNIIRFDPLFDKPWDALQYRSNPIYWKWDRYRSNLRNPYGESTDLWILWILIVSPFMILSCCRLSFARNDEINAARLAEQLLKFNGQHRVAQSSCGGRVQAAMVNDADHVRGKVNPLDSTRRRGCSSNSLHSQWMENLEIDHTMPSKISHSEPPEPVTLPLPLSSHLEMSGHRSAKQPPLPTTKANIFAKLYKQCPPFINICLDIFICLFAVVFGWYWFMLSFSASLRFVHIIWHPVAVILIYEGWLCIFLVSLFPVLDLVFTPLRTFSLVLEYSWKREGTDNDASSLSLLKSTLCKYDKLSDEIADKDEEEGIFVSSEEEASHHDSDTSQSSTNSEQRSVSKLLSTKHIEAKRCCTSTMQYAMFLLVFTLLIRGIALMLDLVTTDNHNVKNVNGSTHLQSRSSVRYPHSGPDWLAPWSGPLLTSIIVLTAWCNGYIAESILGVPISPLKVSSSLGTSTENLMLLLKLSSSASTPSLIEDISPAVWYPPLKLYRCFYMKMLLFVCSCFCLVTLAIICWMTSSSKALKEESFDLGIFAHQLIFTMLVVIITLPPKFKVGIKSIVTRLYEFVCSCLYFSWCGTLKHAERDATEPGCSSNEEISRLKEIGIDQRRVAGAVIGSVSYRLDTLNKWRLFRKCIGRMVIISLLFLIGNAVLSLLIHEFPFQFPSLCIQQEKRGFLSWDSSKLKLHCDKKQSFKVHYTNNYQEAFKQFKLCLETDADYEVDSSTSSRQSKTIFPWYLTVDRKLQKTCEANNQFVLQPVDPRFGRHVYCIYNPSHGLYVTSKNSPIPPHQCKESERFQITGKAVSAEIFSWLLHILPRFFQATFLINGPAAAINVYFILFVWEYRRLFHTFSSTPTTGISPSNIKVQWWAEFTSAICWFWVSLHILCLICHGNEQFVFGVQAYGEEANRHWNKLEHLEKWLLGTFPSTLSNSLHTWVLGKSAYAPLPLCHGIFLLQCFSSVPLMVLMILHACSSAIMGGKTWIGLRVSKDKYQRLKVAACLLHLVTALCCTAWPVGRPQAVGIGVPCPDVSQCWWSNAYTDMMFHRTGDDDFNARTVKVKGVTTKDPLNPTSPLLSSRVENRQTKRNAKIQILSSVSTAAYSASSAPPPALPVREIESNEQPLLTAVAGVWSTSESFSTLGYWTPNLYATYACFISSFYYTFASGTFKSLIKTMAVIYVVVIFILTIATGLENIATWLFALCIVYISKFLASTNNSFLTKCCCPWVSPLTDTVKEAVWFPGYSFSKFKSARRGVNRSVSMPLTEKNDNDLLSKMSSSPISGELISKEDVDASLLLKPAAISRSQSNRVNGRQNSGTLGVFQESFNDLVSLALDGEFNNDMNANGNRRLVLNSNSLVTPVPSPRPDSLSMLEAFNSHCGLKTNRERIRSSLNQRAMRKGSDDFLSSEELLSCPSGSFGDEDDTSEGVDTALMFGSSSEVQPTASHVPVEVITREYKRNLQFRRTTSENHVPLTGQIP